MQKLSYTLVAATALLLVGAGCSTTPSQSYPTKTEGTETTPSAQQETTQVTDWSQGQSTGAQTVSVPNTEKGNEYRNTLVDKEIGVQVTCPVDKTWKCTLGSSGKFNIADMSSNVFSLRVVPGVSSMDEALAKEQKYLEATLPGVVKESSTGGVAVFTVGPDPSWAVAVNRKAWVQVKEVNNKFIACHGLGAVDNFENDSPDFKEMCDSVKADN